MGEYHFGTRWVVQALRDQVWQAIAEAETWPTWWKGVRSVEVLDPGAADGVGTADS
ncbi:MAG: SRPBCC family protein [Egibacteraceae bacterium]